MHFHFRIIKSIIVFCFSLLFAFFVFNNLAEYNLNLEYVRDIFSMQEIEGAGRTWRAVSSPFFQILCYWFIILIETSAAALLLIGGLYMVKNIKSDGLYKRGTFLAAYGITAGLLLFLVGFTEIGCEWFLLWVTHSDLQIKSLMFSILCLMGLLLLISPEKS